MADRIKLLPEVVANQIAAGEVVNRPSSVVKEMMENSIDAGARTVTVNCCDGGRELIQIVDDGCGMSPIDARTAFARHATSKISSVEDIYKLRTFGFRGEALASIAAVSQVELRTRQHDDEIGTQIFVDGGEVRSQEVTMCPAGSQFYVRNLFYNVPARRRFLDKSTTSARQIRDEFERVALCNPSIAFRLYNNNASVYDLPATNLRSRIVDIVGKNIRSNLLEVSVSTSLVHIEGFVGRPAAAKKSSYKQFLFVNGRYFKSPYFYKAVVKAYEKLIPATTQPDYFLYLEIDPERIDVNVHPQKTEVKFADSEAIWQIINAAVRETLAKTGAVPMMDFESEGQADIPVAGRGDRIYAEPRAVSVRNYNPFREDYTSPHPDAGRRSRADISDFSPFDDAPSEKEAYDIWPSDAPASAGDLKPAAAPAGESLRDVLPIAENYESSFDFVDSGSEIQQRMEAIDEQKFEDVLPLGDALAAARFRRRLVVVDLRRARERVSYEDYLLMIGNGSSVSQQLLFPERLVLSNDEARLLDDCREDLQMIGFDLRQIDECTIELTGTPADMEGVEIDRLLFDAMHASADGHNTPAAVRRQRLAAMVAQRRAAAMRGNIGAEQASALLDALVQCDNISFSPSGGQIMIEITRDEIRARLA